MLLVVSASSSVRDSVRRGGAADARGGFAVDSFFAGLLCGFFFVVVFVVVGAVVVAFADTTEMISTSDDGEDTARTRG
jgi:hypothetical protein